MAIIQNNPSDQAGGGSVGGPSPSDAERANAGRGRTAGGTAAGHTTPNAGTGADLSDLITDGDGSYDGDVNASTDDATIRGGRGGGAS